MNLRQELKAETMGCWWPSRYNGASRPDWDGIVGDLEVMLHSERFYFEERGSNQGRIDHLQRLLKAAETRR